MIEITLLTFDGYIVGGMYRFIKWMKIIISDIFKAIYRLQDAMLHETQGYRIDWSPPKVDNLY